MKHILVDDADRCRQPDNTQHLKTRDVVLISQCQPVNNRSTSNTDGSQQQNITYTWHQHQLNHHDSSSHT